MKAVIFTIISSVLMFIASKIPDLLVIVVKKLGWPENIFNEFSFYVLIFSSFSLINSYILFKFVYESECKQKLDRCNYTKRNLKKDYEAELKKEIKNKNEDIKNLKEHHKSDIKKLSNENKQLKYKVGEKDKLINMLNENHLDILKKKLKEDTNMSTQYNDIEID